MNPFKSLKILILCFALSCQAKWLPADDNLNYGAMESFHVALCRVSAGNGYALNFSGPLAKDLAFEFSNSFWVISEESQKDNILTIDVADKNTAGAIVFETGFGNIWLCIDDSKSKGRLKELTSENFTLFRKLVEDDLTLLKRKRKWNSPVPNE